MSENNTIKTVDGKPAINGKCYHLENGQQVSLISCATTPDGKDVFLVTPFYEGETMTVSGDGGSHCEYTAEYEHEGGPMLVDAIFVEAPLDKLDDRYKARLDDIEKVSLSLGLSLQVKSDIIANNVKLNNETEEADRLCTEAAGKLKMAREELESLCEKLTEKRQKLSELEDSIGCLLKNGGSATMVETSELQRLNKRDLKLQCLENGGVDNWTFYDDSLDDFRARYPG